MKIVGYMEGTDPEVLTKLIVEGHETLPLSNGIDHHGKNITHLTNADNIALVVGYLHKFITLAPGYSLIDVLSSVRVYKIPVIFIVPKEIQDKANSLVSEKGITYKLTDPADLSKAVFESLSG